jgi:hypothetical protein
MSAANELLRMLGSGTGNVGAASRVRPGSPAGVNAPIDGAAFADLLAQAQNGELASGTPVVVDDDAGVALSDAELQQLSLAADRAEAQGVRRALVLSGDKALLLDVQTRTVLGQAEVKDGVVSGIDGVIRLGGAGAAAGADLLPVPSGSLAAHPSLASLLLSRSGDAA